MSDNKSFEEWKKAKRKEAEQDRETMSDKFTYSEGELIVHPPKREEQG